MTRSEIYQEAVWLKDDEAASIASPTPTCRPARITPAATATAGRRRRAASGDTPPEDSEETPPDAWADPPRSAQATEVSAGPDSFSIGARGGRADGRSWACSPRCGSPDLHAVRYRTGPAQKTYGDCTLPGVADLCTRITAALAGGGGRPHARR